MIAKKRSVWVLVLAVTVLGSSLVALAALDILRLGPPPGPPSPEAQMTVHESLWMMLADPNGLSLKVDLTLNNTGREVSFVDLSRFQLELFNGSFQQPDGSATREGTSTEVPELLHPLTGARFSLVFPRMAEDSIPETLTFGYEWEGKVRAPVPAPNAWPAKAEMTPVVAYWTAVWEDGFGTLTVEFLLTNHDVRELFAHYTRFSVRTASAQSYGPVYGPSYVLEPGRTQEFRIAYNLPLGETPTLIGFSPYWGDNVTAEIPLMKPTTSVVSVSVSSMSWQDAGLRIVVYVCNTDPSSPTSVTPSQQSRLLTDGRFFEPKPVGVLDNFRLAPWDQNTSTNSCKLFDPLFFDVPREATPDSLHFGWPWEDPLVVAVSFT